MIRRSLSDMRVSVRYTFFCSAGGGLFPWIKTLI